MPTFKNKNKREEPLQYLSWDYLSDLKLFQTAFFLIKSCVKTADNICYSDDQIIEKLNIYKS